jgi:hypothetical protein
MSLIRVLTLVLTSYGFSLANAATLDEMRGKCVEFVTAKLGYEFLLKEPTLKGMIKSLPQIMFNSETYVRCEVITKDSESPAIKRIRVIRFESVGHVVFDFVVQDTKADNNWIVLNSGVVPQVDPIAPR